MKFREIMSSDDDEIVENYELRSWNNDRKIMGLTDENLRNYVVNFD